MNGLSPDANSPQGAVWFLFDQTSAQVGTIDGDDYGRVSGITAGFELMYAGSYQHNNNTYHNWKAWGSFRQGQNNGYSGADDPAVTLTDHEVTSPVTQLHKDDAGELSIATYTLAGNLDMDATEAHRSGKTVILVDTSSARSIKLPDADEIASGRIFIIKDKTGGVPD